jgi:hypothetical protein
MKLRMLVVGMVGIILNKKLKKLLLSLLRNILGMDVFMV